LVLAAVIGILFVLPFFVLIVEILLVALVATLGIVFRIVFRRPWLVEAFAEEGAYRKHFIWKVSGIQRSGVVVDQVAEQIRLGVPTPTPTDGTLVQSAY
jgi:hypothetical protein